MKARNVEPGIPTTITLLTGMRQHNDDLKQTDLRRMSAQMGQLSQMLEQEADGLFERLEDLVIHRVAQRNVGGVVVL